MITIVGPAGQPGPDRRLARPRRGAAGRAAAAGTGRRPGRRPRTPAGRFAFDGVPHGLAQLLVQPPEGGVPRSSRPRSPSDVRRGIAAERAARLHAAGLAVQRQRPARDRGAPAARRAAAGRASRGRRRPGRRRDPRPAADQPGLGRVGTGPGRRTASGCSTRRSGGSPRRSGRSCSPSAACCSSAAAATRRRCGSTTRRWPCSPSSPARWTWSRCSTTAAWCTWRPVTSGWPGPTCTAAGRSRPGTGSPCTSALSQVNLGCMDVVAGDLPAALGAFAAARAEYSGWPRDGWPAWRWSGPGPWWRRACSPRPTGTGLRGRAGRRAAAQPHLRRRAAGAGGSRAAGAAGRRPPRSGPGRPGPGSSAGTTPGGPPSRRCWSCAPIWLASYPGGRPAGLRSPAGRAGRRGDRDRHPGAVAGPAARSGWACRKTRGWPAWSRRARWSRPASRTGPPGPRPAAGRRATSTGWTPACCGG